MKGNKAKGKSREAREIDLALDNVTDAEANQEMAEMLRRKKNVNAGMRF